MDKEDAMNLNQHLANIANELKRIADKLEEFESFEGCLSTYEMNSGMRK